MSGNPTPPAAPKNVRKGPPTSRLSGRVANGRGARELPFASAVLMRRDLAQKRSLVRCS
jgi:hypothetical protein